MADLTVNTLHDTAPKPTRASFVVKNATALVGGTLVGVEAAGFLVNWGPDTAGHYFLGMLLADATGNTSATPPVEGRVNTEGLVIRNVTVASLVQADVGTLVYCGTNNPADFTLTAQTNVKAVGWVSRFISAGRGDVTLFTPSEHRAL